MTDKMWEQATIEERKAVVDCYNKYYNKDNELSFEWCDAVWSGSRWITIYYTFGVKPV